MFFGDISARAVQSYKVAYLGEHHAKAFYSLILGKNMPGQYRFMFRVTLPQSCLVPWSSRKTKCYI